jgi:katanin p60 ATPase-containing subunit A1
MGPPSGDAKLPSVHGAAPLPSPPTGGAAEGLDGLALKGSAVSNKPNSDQDTDTSIERVENRLLKPPPQFGFDAEMKQLASVISREIYQESPNVRFEDIVGLEEAKRLLSEAVQLPLKFPSIFQGLLR